MTEPKALYMSTSFGIGRRGFIAAAMLALTCGEACGQTSAPAAQPSREVAVVGPKPFIAYFKATPIVEALSKDAWGSDAVGPRDQGNGLEDRDLKAWNYWDGSIVKGPDGKYRMFASRWDEAAGHRGWGESHAIGAVSNSLFGPYKDMGKLWPADQNGRGHNVSALRMPDGRYAIVVSETRQGRGDVFVSGSVDGPWTLLGSISVDQSKVRSLRNPGEAQAPAGAEPRPWRASNVTVILRPDGDYQIVERSGQILISKNGILGPYEPQGPTIYRSLAGLPQRDLGRLEDPTLWYSGGWYHVLVNHWEERRAYHLISRNGIDGWIVQGLAYEPNADFIHYASGVTNHWNKLERPGVVIEGGHVVALTFAVIDVPKDQELGGDRHGSKVIVVPFDGAAMDRDLARVDGKGS
jgi:hypothetical protein